MTTIGPQTIIYDGLSARGLVELVTELRDRVCALEDELREVRALADEAHSDANSTSVALEHLQSALEAGEYSE